MRRFPRRSRRFRRGKREFIWTSVIAPEIALTQTSVGAPSWPADVMQLVLPADWERGTLSMQKGAVLLRIVGDVVFYSDTNGGGLAALRAANQRFNSLVILKRDVGNSAAVDFLAGTPPALDEDVLHAESGRFDWFFENTPTLSWANGVNQTHFKLDVRTKRKLTTNDQIVMGLLTLRENLDTDVAASVQLRSLVQLP